MDNEALKERISEKLKDHYSIDSNGLFYDSIYMDYNDELSNQTLQEILSSDDPESHFYELFDEAYLSAVWNLEDQAIDRLRADPDLNAAWEKDQERFRDILFDQFYVNLPYDDFLSKPVELLLVIDTGDANYDYTLNSFAHGYYGAGEEGVDENSSLLWLCQQQGVTKEELDAANKSGSYYPREIEAVIERRAEVQNALRELGFIPSNTMDPYNQKGELRTLLQAELAVRNLEQKVHRCEANLATCDLPYEDFCKTWSARNKTSPPNQNIWMQRKQSVQERNQEVLCNLRPDLMQAKETLQSCLKDPRIAMTADLRNRLQELNKEYSIITQTATYKKGRLLESVIQESANTTTHMNALTALIKLPLRDAINLTAAIQAEKNLNASYEPKERKGKGSVLLGEDTTLGLYDAWNGAGGLFEIQLCQPLELPIRYIHDANVDGNLGYSIQQIYGGLEHGETLKEIRSMTETIKPPLNQVLQSVQPTLQEKQATKSETSRSER